MLRALALTHSILVYQMPSCDPKPEKAQDVCDKEPDWAFFLA